MTYDPNFPNRPQHADFDALSKAIIATDNLADKGITVEDILILAGIDLNSLFYMADQRSLRVPLGTTAEQARGSVAAGWIDGFLAGRRFTQNRGKTEVTTVLDDSIDGNRRHGH